MFYLRNKEPKVYKGKDFYAPVKVNPETKEIIDLAASLLTPEQLKTFELSGNDETFTFQDRMEMYYGEMWPVHSLKESEETIRTKIKSYEDLFEIGIRFKQNEYFIEKLHVLFEKNKGESEKRWKEIEEIMKKYSSSN